MANVNMSKNTPPIAFIFALVIIGLIFILGIILKQKANFPSPQPIGLSESEIKMIEQLAMLQNYDLILKVAVSKESVPVEKLEAQLQQPLNKNFESFRAMPLNEQVKIRRNWHRFNKLSAEEQMELRAKFQYWQTQNHL